MCIFRLLAVVFALVLGLVILSANFGVAGFLDGWLYDFRYGDKVGHFFLMGLLAFLVSLGFSLARVRVFGVNLLVNSLALAALVTLEEISQMFFDNRTFSFFDLSASLAGVFLFGELGALLRRSVFRSMH